MEPVIEAVPPQTISRRSLSLALAFSAVAALALLVPVLPHVERLALTIINIAVVVLYLMLRRRKGGADYLEVILPYSVLHILYFDVSALYLAYDPQSLRIVSLEPYLTSALALGLVGFLAFLLGYALFFTRAAASRAQGLIPRNVFVCLVPGVLGLVGYLACAEQARQVSLDAGLSGTLSAVQNLAPFFLFSWFLTWTLFWSDTTKMRHRIVVLAITPMAIAVIALTFGSKELGITVIAFPVLAYGYARRVFPLKSFVALILVFVFVIFPIYNSFRQQGSQLGTVARLERSLADSQRWDADAYMDRSVRAFFSRMAVITSVAAILKDTGRWVEFQKGRTLVLAPIGLVIPRFLWPEKPVLSIGREFGLTFQLIAIGDRETNIAPTMLGELYWNFHIPGVVLGMLALGGGYRWYYERYGRGQRFDPVRRSIYMTLLTQALHSEGGIAISIAGITKVIVMFALMTFLFRRMGMLVPDTSAGHSA